MKDGRFVKISYKEIVSDYGNIIPLKLYNGTIAYLKSGDPTDKRKTVMAYYYKPEIGVIVKTQISCKEIASIGKAQTTAEFEIDHPNGIFTKIHHTYNEEPPKTNFIKAAKSIWDDTKYAILCGIGFIAFWVIARLIVYLLYKVGWMWLAAPLDFLLNWVGL